MTLKKSLSRVLTLLFLGLSGLPTQASHPLPDQDRSSVKPALSLSHSQESCWESGDFLPPQGQNPLAQEPEDTLNTPQVLKILETLGLCTVQGKALWEDLMALRKLKPSSFSLASTDPYFLALGLWKAHQITLSQDQESQKKLPFGTLLRCTLTRGVPLKNIPLRPFDLQILSSLMQINPYCKTLDLFKLSLKDQEVALLTQVWHLTQVSLEENHLTDAALPSLLALPALKVLNLSKNAITAQGAWLLSQSSRLTSLTLYKNALGDTGAEALARNTVLLELDLRETGLGDRGALALAANEHLRSLRLRYNAITDKGAEGFLRNTSLTYLELARNPISPELMNFLEHQWMPGHGYKAELDRSLRSVPKTLLPIQKQTVRILSVDGGGIRGLLPAKILHFIAESVAHSTGAKDFHFAEHFDLMAGTSTGGLIALALSTPGERGRPLYTPEVLVDLYTQKGKDIFPAPWSSLKKVSESQYSADPLKALLTHYFGEKPLSSCLGKVLITSFDLNNNQAHTFDSQEARQQSTKDFLIRYVAQATAAAPTYFPSATVNNVLGEPFNFVDGGIYANNPTLLALKRARELYPDAQVYKVLSLGTGEGLKKNLSKLSNKGLIHWGLNISGILMANAARYTEELLQKECAQDPRIQYIRIQPALSNPGEKSMDNVKAMNIQNLLSTAHKTLENHEGPLEAIIKDLLRDYEKQ